MRQFKHDFLTLWILLTVIFSLTSSPAFSAEVQKVLIPPFNIYSEEDLSFLREGIRDMLTSRLSEKNKVSVLTREESAAYFDTESKAYLTEKRAKEIGKELNADYVLMGSLTVFGTSVSIDAKMIGVTGKTQPLSFYNQSKGMEEVIPKINAFAEQVRAEVFGIRPEGAVLAAAQPEPAKKDIYAHPETRLSGDIAADEPAYESPPAEQGAIIYSDPNPGRPAGAVSAPAAGVPAAQPQAEETPSAFNMENTAATGQGAEVWKSRDFELRLHGLALGDVDGDGKIETVIMDSQHIQIFRYDRGRRYTLKEFKGRSYQQFLSVDVADINKNGRAEIFVSCERTQTRRLDSFVLEWNGRDFGELVTGDTWYYNVVNHPVRGPILLGQKRGLTDLFTGQVEELSWSGRWYEPAGGADIPELRNVYGLAVGDVMNNGSMSVIAFDKSDRINLRSYDGKSEWKSADEYGGSENGMRIVLDKDSKNMQYIPLRLVVADLDGNGRNEVITVRNEALTGRLFRSFRKYNKGKFQSLSWNGAALVSNWTTDELSGYISDFAIGDFENDGSIELVGTLVTRRGSAFHGSRSNIVAYNLDRVMAKTSEPPAVQ